VGEFWDNVSFFFSKIHRRFKKWFLFFGLLLLTFFIFRVPILKGLGSFLVKESKLEQADAIFILGGNVFDRPMAALDLYHKGYANKLIPLGANTGLTMLAWHNGDEDKSFSDALVMQEFLLSRNVPFEDVIPINEGTSTKEESESILKFCKDNKYKTIIVVSDSFHLRRISYVFVDRFADAGIKVILRGASHSEYNEEYWWQFEQGLIMLNNEYVKLAYYWLKGY